MHQTGRSSATSGVGGLAEAFNWSRVPAMKTAARTKADGTRRGRLRIGDDWNAITIIATSQSSPLKAVAEFVENSIDAKARRVIITRGRERGEYYLRIAD